MTKEDLLKIVEVTTDENGIECVCMIKILAKFGNDANISKIESCHWDYQIENGTDSTLVPINSVLPLLGVVFSDIEQLKERQIAVFEKEKQLHAETQNLLFDVLNEVLVNDKYMKESLFGYNMIDEDQLGDDVIISDVLSAETLEIDVDGEIHQENIDNLSQIQQKLIIDYIMFNIFMK